MTDPTALTQPEPQGATDEELLSRASYYGIDYVDVHRSSELDAEKAPVRSDELCIFARSAIAVDRARFGRPAIEPVPAMMLPRITDETLLNAADAYFLYGENKYVASPEEGIAFAREMISEGHRWGRPVITPISASATADDDYRENWNIRSETGSLCFASAIYARLVGGEQDESELRWLAEYLRVNSAITPIPVSERPWEREGWCDAEGRCWLFGKVEGDWKLRNPVKCGLPRPDYCFSDSLPHWALPVPQQEATDGP